MESNLKKKLYNCCNVRNLVRFAALIRIHFSEIIERPHAILPVASFMSHPVHRAKIQTVFTQRQ